MDVLESKNTEAAHKTLSSWKATGQERLCTSVVLQSFSCETQILLEQLCVSQC